MAASNAIILVFDNFKYLAALCLQQFKQDLSRVVGKCLQRDMSVEKGFQHIVKQRFGADGRKVIRDVDGTNNGFYNI